MSACTKKPTLMQEVLQEGHQNIYPRRYVRKSVVDGRLVWMLAFYAIWIVVCVDWLK